MNNELERNKKERIHNKKRQPRNVANATNHGACLFSWFFCWSCPCAIHSPAKRAYIAEMAQIMSGETTVPYVIRIECHAERHLLYFTKINAGVSRR
jgi:hypothetical protein